MIYAVSQYCSREDPLIYLFPHSRGGARYSVSRFLSGINIDDKLQLSDVKAVSETYPLRGDVETSLLLDGLSEVDSLSTMKSGQIWAAPTLFSSLEIAPNVEVRIGRSLFNLNKVLMLWNS